MNFEKKEKFYKNVIIQREEEENARFKKVVHFQKNIVDIKNEFAKRNEYYKLKEEIKNYKLKIGQLQNENNLLKNKVQLYQAEMKNFRDEIEMKNERINHLLAENDITNKLYKDIYHITRLQK
ncbi:hypothetical protein, conserved [Plasmodium gonderi]|uniref:Uncharacterized protein n=1 Tax=Plasmodium gonderi TaxID=77519 RepID=A0A1Y1JL67_PLAGO|nr:hypothetical protein, conserved [Plasmodium gonderi]GAW81957.1 hypothetical protein, conserved [Plasmodium gonderi]